MELVKENGGISVKRYTKRLTDGQAVMDCQSCPESWMGKSGERCTALYCRNRLKDRVAAYEDTGLDPEDILSATDTAKVACALHELNQYKDLGSIDRLRELLEADRDGRCIVLPCKEGDKLRRDGIEFTADHWNLTLTAFAEDKSTKSGKRVGLFGVKEAEAALKARDGE